MVRLNLNILRNLRMQIKSGYLKEAPPEYNFMLKYPPLNRDKAPPIRKLETRTIPYLKLYNQAIARNPILKDEKVYPAFWQHEPQALTLAKKQYELMQTGLDEDSAYNKAVEYIEALESTSYESLRELLDNMEERGAKMPFVADNELSLSISEWKEKLLITSYEDLTFADQGELDQLIQMKILKWNEVERERRMKDPIFAMQFDRLRTIIFPDSDVNRQQSLIKEHENYKNKLLSLYNVTQTKLVTSSPFYVEDYAAHFAKLKVQPLLSRWSESEREELSRWIINTLAYREIIEKRSSADVQKYLDDLRSHFFPMVRYPELVASMNFPDIQAVKKVLYNNDIGYKSQSDKLFVKRFYKLPVLMFPKETFTTEMLTNQDRLKTLLREENGLLREITSAGLDEASLPELQEQLNKYVNGKGGNYINSYQGNSSEIDMSSLDALLKDDDDDNHVVKSKKSVKSHGKTKDTISTGFGRGAEWDALVEKYRKTPVTVLEHERERMFSQLEYNNIEDTRAEVDLYDFKRTRIENQIVSRAKLSVRYEQKEAARRAREWRQRDVLLQKLPSPQLSLM
jgi:hypothetical protein